ncbi:hypothetical protein BpHYR1_014963 [Brachionus plicatilis]|uniref:Uncharacterized protein n=1 Tax=Brachionus plicatilis TaxID=10195 RepID=A0A3M7QTZ6_BRAPC|nr:hypothetical protein BpHYR1_014963 [Brachionus plicatilis]
MDACKNCNTLCIPGHVSLVLNIILTNPYRPTGTVFFNKLSFTVSKILLVTYTRQRIMSMLYSKIPQM